MKRYASKAFSLSLVVCLIGLFAESTMAQSTKKGSATKEPVSMMKPVAITGGVASISPANSKIEFIGIHVGDDPKPRLGGFKKFKGQIKLATDKSVESLKLEIDVNSVWTQFDDLTKHLKNADFFETEKYPNAIFESAKITASDQGMQVTGMFTLHGATKEISFPVKGRLDDAGVMMVSEFKLDRTMFGMDKMTSGVDKMVSLKFVVGEKTEVSKSAPGPGVDKKQSKTETGSAVPTSITLLAPNML